MNVLARSSTAEVLLSSEPDRINVRWTVPLEVADAVLAIVGRNLQERALLHLPLPAELVGAITPLRAAVIEGYDRLVEELLGEAIDASEVDIGPAELISSAIPAVEEVNQRLVPVRRSAEGTAPAAGNASSDEVTSRIRGSSTPAGTGPERGDGNEVVAITRGARAASRARRTARGPSAPLHRTPGPRSDTMEVLGLPRGVVDDPGTEEALPA